MTTNPTAQKKFNRWSSRLDDSSEDVRATAIEMLSEVGRDSLELRNSVSRELERILRTRPDDRSNVLYKIYFNLEECVASDLALMSAVIFASNAPESEGIGMKLLWRLIEQNRLTVGHPLLEEVRAAATKYLRSETEADRDAAFQIVDWCDDNLG